MEDAEAELPGWHRQTRRLDKRPAAKSPTGESDPQTYAVIGAAIEVQLTSLEGAQRLNYLKATGLRRGLLINFGAALIECKRMVV